MLTKAINPVIYLTIDIHILIGHNALKKKSRSSKCPDFEDCSQQYLLCIFNFYFKQKIRGKRGITQLQFTNVKPFF